MTFYDKLCTSLLIVVFITNGSTSQNNYEIKRGNHLPLLIETHKLSLVTGLSNLENFNTILDNILITRVVGTVNHEIVKNYIINFMQRLNWKVEVDDFDDVTPNFGSLKFGNIIATLNPNADRFLVIAAHYDSKYFPNEEFLGASDSAVSVAMMLNMANVLNNYLEINRLNNELSIKFVFFDGEEAFVEWGPNDSIYGARHLAKKWKDEGFLPRIDMMVLLDLLGGPDPLFYSFFKNTENWYQLLVTTEDRLNEGGYLERYATSSVSTQRQANRFFQPYSVNAGIEDDHIPFLRENVPILHVIPTPFPDVWHKVTDNRQAVELVTVENLSKIFRIFILEYLQIRL